MTDRRGACRPRARALLAVALVAFVPVQPSSGEDGLESPDPVVVPDAPGLHVTSSTSVTDPAAHGPRPTSSAAPEGGTPRRDAAGPGVAFLRAHVARRMQRFAGHDPELAADAILAASRASRIDPVLLLAIIEVESAFDPLARSHRNALGLMQVRPATLWREAERSGLEGDDPHDPELNVLAGALYLRRLVDAFGLNDVALMAYNAGPNRILGIIRAGEEIPDRYREYPRRVRAAEARLREALAVDSAGAALVRAESRPGALRLE